MMSISKVRKDMTITSKDGRLVKVRRRERNSVTGQILLVTDVGVLSFYPDAQVKVVS